MQRVTVTLPADIVEDIDRREPNRSRFILDAVRRELFRRRCADLKRSLKTPHPETKELTDAGFKEWQGRLPAGYASDLLREASGRPVRWIPRKGWRLGK